MPEMSDHTLLSARRQEAAQNSPLIYRGFMTTGRGLNLKNRENAFNFGDPAREVFRVVRGCVLLQRMNKNGRFINSNIAFPGDIIGDAPEGTYAWSAQAAGPASLRAVPKADFEKAVGENGPMAPELAKILANQLQRSYELLAINHTGDCTTKTASFFMWFQKNSQKKLPSHVETVDFPFSAERIGEILGFSREAIEASIRKLCQDGCIAKSETDKRVSFQIRDLPKLRKLAEE